MSKWEVKKLGEVSKIISGYAFNSDDFHEVEGVPVIKIANIRDGVVEFNNTTQYVSKDYLESLNAKYIIKNGDVLISLTGSHITQPNSMVGRTALYRKKTDSLLNQRAGKIIGLKNKGNERFVYYLLRTQWIREYIGIIAHGAANQANISPKDIERIKCLIPPMSTQKKIADILSPYDDLIENNNRRIELLEKAAQEIYKEWFVRMRFPGYKNTQFENGLPVGCEFKKLSDIAKIQMGQSPKSEFYNEENIGLPFHQGVTYFNKRYPTHKVFCTENKRVTNKEDILLSVRAPVGRINIADTKIVIGRGLCSIRHKEEHNSYLYYFLTNYFQKEDILGNGSIFNSVGKDQLFGVKVLVPTETIVKKFESLVIPMDKQIQNLYKQNQNLIKQRDLLLPRLISGKLEV